MINSDQYSNDVLCTYKFEFSVNASPKDLMKVEFIKATKTGLGFGVGTSFRNAEGQKISQPEGKQIII